ncbi:proteoglycan 4 isoform X1 [Cyprinodon tularosa]|uniref:proteoglycan 4 isoform X1 n=1 Tax=Cyprinodon tularosa TaxID=77115 RepID=UPI0018E1E0A0|nr:proteoglycan 4 isoform X1 [Cyprinodon tularosa]
MKKGLHFLGRKNQSLYDTNIKIQDRDNIELVLDSKSAVFESGTAKVKARPTVKHHTSSLEAFQGFAVPTPTVPDLPPANGPKINGTAPGQEEKIFVPPPPSMAPPPPPVDFIPPPPDFMGDLNSLDPLALQPPSMPAPKPPSLVEEDLSILKPPPMAPPKPPSTCSTGSGSSVPISVPPAKVPERPKFAPPQPPTEKQQKTVKVPPPKPIRLSSMSTLESPPHSPAPPPPIQSSKLSTFNPQNKAKVYDPPEPTFPSQKPKAKQMLLLQESGSVESAPVLVTVDGKAPQASQLTKPEPRAVNEVKEALEIKQDTILPEFQKEKKIEVKTESKKAAPIPAPIVETKAENVPTQSDITKPLQPPSSQKTTSVQINSHTNKNQLKASPAQGRSFSPLLDRKLYSLKANETKPSTSPLALLQAAKEREKQRTTSSLSRESSTKMSESVYSNSSTDIPRSTSSIIPSQIRPNENATVRPVEQKIQSPEKPLSPTALAKDQKLSNDLVLTNFTASPTVNSLGEQKQRAEEKLSKLQDEHNDIPKEVTLPLLPPPPEFGDFDDQIPESPPSIRPPDPPSTKAPAPPEVTPTPLVVTKSPAPAKALAQTPAPAKALAQTPAPAKAPAQIPAPAKAPAQIPAPAKAPAQTPAPAKAPAQSPPPAKAPSQSLAPPPKLPPPDVHVKPKAPVQTKSSPVPTQQPNNISSNQATLLSILQKKMLEMDHKMAPVNKSEQGSDEWGSSLFDEDNKMPPVPKPKQESKNPPTPTNKTASLDMKELENKVLHKNQQSTQVKSPTTKNGIQSRHQYGLTFTIRPGTKQPITLVNKGH